MTDHIVATAPPPGDARHRRAAPADEVEAVLRGWTFDIQRYSLHDGPGIRTTVFLKGCPLDCWWCHNPEGRAPQPVISLLPERCIGCGTCLESCPHGVALPLDRVPDEPAEVGKCVLCGTCAEVCPSGARTTVGHSYSVQDLVKEVDRDRIFYDESGGGVTFSGGEPLAPKRNAEFLVSCLEACRERGFHRTVDTSGFAPLETILSVADLTDLFLVDIKHMDDERHRDEEDRSFSGGCHALPWSCTTQIDEYMNGARIARRFRPPARTMRRC